MQRFPGAVSSGRRSKNPLPRSHPMSRSCLAAALFAVVAVTGCNPPDTVASNKAMIHEYHVDIWNQHDLGAVDTFIAPDFVSHANTPDTPPGPGPVKGFLGALFTAFPDLTSQE